jgi:colicin import membrane protein
MRHLWLLVAMWAPAVAASDFGTRYPAGSIRDAEQAQAVLKEADAEMARIGQNAKARDAECLRGFLVNSCRDDVRREKELAEREVKRVRVEARDLQRRIDAEKVAKRRADKDAARALEDAQRPQNEQKARAASEAREAQVQRREPGTTKDDTPAQAGSAQKAEPDRRPAQSRVSAADRAENVRKFQQKQVQAQKRAQEKEAEHKENEQRRAKKRQQVEQREAEREAIRKKADESIK